MVFENSPYSTRSSDDLKPLSRRRAGGRIKDSRSDVSKFDRLRFRSAHLDSDDNFDDQDDEDFENLDDFDEDDELADFEDFEDDFDPDDDL